MIFSYHGIFGFDISTYQDSPAISGNVDFHKMRDYGASFVVIKASQGNWNDVDFLTNWHNSKGVLPRSSYHYFDNRFDPKVQARKYWDTISIDSEGICWLDLEDRELGDYSGWRNWYDFLEEFKNLSQLPSERIGIYTGFYYWNERLRNATMSQLDYFVQYPLWLASYPEDPFHPDYWNILCPPPWSSPLILQSGTPAIGVQVGVESIEVDYDQFNGDETTFNNYFDITTTPPPNGGSMRVIKGVALGTVKRRQSPAGAEFVPPRYLYTGDRIEASENSNQWLHITKINDVAISGDEWASAGATQQYIRWEWVEVTIPPEPPTVVLTHTIQVYSDGSLRIDGNPYP